jgi:hypothetical protein
MPPTLFFFLKKKIPKKQKPKKKYKYMLGWPNHPIGGGRPPLFCFLFWIFFKKKNVLGAFWE